MNIQGIGQGYTGMTTQMANRNQGGGDPANMDVGQMIEQADQDSDGVLSIEETPLSEEEFTNADTDGDGFLTQEEMEEMLASSPPPAMGGGMPMGGPEGDGPPDFESILAEEDTDGDGTISAEESALSSEMFASFDADGDGLITQEEFDEMAPSGPPSGGGGMSMGGPEGGGAPPDFESLLSEEDTDGDGTISAEESALSSEMFASFDADGDGLITQEEFDEMAPPQELTDDLTRNTAISAYQDAVSQFMTYQNVDDNAILSTLI